MSDKPWEKILEIGRLIRLAKPSGMDDGVHVVIEYFSGFEKFNTRSYHNYGTWSAGYRVKGLGIEVEAEDLDSDYPTTVTEQTKMSREFDNRQEAIKFIDNCPHNNLKNYYESGSYCIRFKMDSTFNDITVGVSNE